MKKIGALVFSTLPPFYSSLSSMILAKRLPVSQSKSNTLVSVRFSMGLHGKFAKIEALIRAGASGKRLWNSSTYSSEFFKFPLGSHVSSRGRNPFQLTKYSNFGWARPLFTHRLSRISRTSYSISSSNSTGSGGGGRIPLTSFPFQGLRQSTWNTGWMRDMLWGRSNL